MVENLIISHEICANMEVYTAFGGGCERGVVTVGIFVGGHLKTF